MANLIIKPTSGGSLVLQDEGGDAALTVGTTGSTTLSDQVFPAGTVLQVVSSTFDGDFTHQAGSEFDNGSSTTRGNNTHASVVTGLNCSVTTKKANSSLFFMMNLMSIITADPASGYPFSANVYWSVDSYAAKVAQGEARGSRRRQSAVVYPRVSNNSYASDSMHWSCLKTTSVAKSTTVTFKVCISSLASQGVFLNYMPDPDSDNDDFSTSVSTTTIFEIAT